MTVKITKPKVNVRGKLNELRKPSGVAGEAMLRAETPQEQQALIGVGRRNLIINGGFAVSQRGDSFTGLTDGSDLYTLDRWRWDERGSGSCVHSVVKSTTAPAGFAYSTKISCTTAGTSGIYYFQQKIEGYNTYGTGWNTSDDGKDVTLSFWFRCSKKGYFGGAITTSDESYGIAFDVEVSEVNEWEYHTVTLPPPPSAHTLNASGTGLILQFAVASDQPAYYGPRLEWHENSSPLHATDRTSISLDTVGDFAFITGVQLETGKVATPFEHRSYGEELALCQRYFEVMSFPGGGVGGLPVNLGQNYQNRKGIGPFNFKATKRATPTIPNVTIGIDGGDGSHTFVARASDNSFHLDSSTSSPNIGTSDVTEGAFTITADAEL